MPNKPRNTDSKDMLMTTSIAPKPAVDRRTELPARRSLTMRARVGMLLAALVAAIAMPALAAAPASASVASCNNGQCTVYFSQSETKAIGQGRVPAAPRWVPPQIKVAYTVTAKVHVLIARQYANRKWCSAFTLNARPYATQGYYGYACNWR